MPLINDLIPCGKGGIELDGFIRKYMVSAGYSISAGDFVELPDSDGISADGKTIEYSNSFTQAGTINAVGGSYSSSGAVAFLKLDDNKMLVIYQNTSATDSDSGINAAVATVTNDKVTLGTFTQISTVTVGSSVTGAG